MVAVAAIAGVLAIDEHYAKRHKQQQRADGDGPQAPELERPVAQHRTQHRARDDAGVEPAR